MNARARCFALALTLPLLGACEGVEVTGVGDEGNDGFETVLASSSVSSGDRNVSGGGIPLFDRLAEQIPGFGGLFRLGRCNIGLVLTRLEEQEQATRIVIEALTPIMGRACADGISVQVQKGEFSYVELMGWLAAGHRLTELRGVHGIAVDFSKNRLVVKVADRATASAVLAAAPGLGIPTAAITFVAGGAGGGR
jgi:hypothetical protein